MTATLHATAVCCHCEVCGDEQLLTGRGCEDNLAEWADAHLNPRVIFATIADDSGAEVGTWTP